jgi:hypothetical protein
MGIRYWVRVCENGDIDSSSNETKTCELCGSQSWVVTSYEVDEDEEQAS